MGFGLACAPVRCAHPFYLARCHTNRGAARPPPPMAALLLLVRPRKRNKIYWTRDANVMGFLSTKPQRLWNRKYPAPAPHIAASLILLTIFLGSTYVPMRPYVLIILVFFYRFWIFSFCYSLFLLSFTLQTCPSFWGVFKGAEPILIHLGSKLVYIPVRP